MACWSSTLSLQLIVAVQKFSNGDIWKSTNDTVSNWQVIYQRSSWPSCFRPEDLRKRWHDLIKQFKEESNVKRAKEVRFEDLAHFFNEPGNKRMAPSQESNDLEHRKIPRSEDVASWRVLLEQTCPFPHWCVTTHQGQVLEPELLFRLANGKVDLQEEEMHLLARASSGFPILTRKEEIVPFLETKASFFFVITSKESAKLAFIDAAQRCFRWRIAPTSTFRFPALPECISQLPQAAVHTRISSSVTEMRIVLLYIISKAPIVPHLGDIFSIWTTAQAASAELFTELVYQGLSLKMRPPVPLESKYLLDALTLLNVNIPEWLQYMGRSIPDSEESHRHVAQCLLEQTNIAIQLAVIQLVNTKEMTFTWTEQSHPLCLLAKSMEQAYAPILRLDQQSNGSIVITFPFPDSIYQVEVDTRPFATVSKSLCIDRFQVLKFLIEGKKITIAVPFKCQICGTTSIALDVSKQEQHLIECTSKQQKSYETQKCLVLSKIDAFLELNCLHRNLVPEDGFCLLRAVLLAQGKGDSHADITYLLNSIWNCAKEKKFASDGITDAQKQELLDINDPVKLYSQMSFSSSFNATVDSAFECFWNMPYPWIAQVLSKDLYLISSPSLETFNNYSCTRYSKDPNVAPAIVPLSELAQLLHNNPAAIALIHLLLPPHTVHLEWLSPTLSTKQLELLKEIFTENETPSVPQLHNVPVPTLSPQTQLETLLSGGSLDLSTSTTTNRYWWSSWESIYQKFRTSTGSIVRYSRQKENPTIWRQYPADTTVHTLEVWYRWHETAKQLPIEELQDLYYLIDVEVEEKDLNELIKEIPMMGLLDDRTSPYSLHTYLRKVCPNLHFPDLRPRLYFAPGILPGAISTPLHLDGFGHMTSYHWYLGFEKDSSNLVDIYRSEEDMGEEKWKQLCHTVGAALSEAGYELPHAVYHDSIATMRHGCDEYDKLAALGIFPTKSIELKAGEILILPAGQPHAFKKWSSTTTTSRGPLVSLAGDIAWIGSTQKETSIALPRMMKVEERLEKSYCLPELSMMACLMCGDQDRSPLFKEHIAVFLPYLRDKVSRELAAFSKVSLTDTATISNDPSIWLCSSCEKMVINTVIWCRIADEAYCLECYPRLSLRRRGESKRARGAEAFTASFRFAHPTALMKKLIELESVIHPATTPKELSLSLPSRSMDEVVLEISEAIRLQKLDTDHRICKLGLDIEKSCDILPKHTQELILLLNRDIPLFCHSEDVNIAECPLLTTAIEREHRYDEFSGRSALSL